MINKALRLIRVFHDLNQTELADRLDVSQSCISDIENGGRKPTLDLINKYADTFDIPSSAIMFFAEALPEAKKGKKTSTAIAGKVLDMLKFIERKSDD